MNITKLEVGQMKANCYLLSDKNDNCIIIDPGDDAEYIISKIQQNNLIPKTIIATHGHLDHVMAALEIKLAFNIPMYMHKADLFLLEKMRSSAKHFLNFNPGPPPEVDIFLKDNAEVEVGDINLKVICTPGHTPGSVSLYDKKNNNLFAGDLIFERGAVGRTDFAYSNKNDLLSSISNILKLPKGTNVYSGHGESFKLSTFPA